MSGPSLPQSAAGFRKFQEPVEIDFWRENSLQTSDYQIIIIMKFVWSPITNTLGMCIGKTCASVPDRNLVEARLRGDICGCTTQHWKQDGVKNAWGAGSEILCWEAGSEISCWGGPAQKYYVEISQLFWDNPISPIQSNEGASGALGVAINVMI